MRCRHARAQRPDLRASLRFRLHAKPARERRAHGLSWAKCGTNHGSTELLPSRTGVRGATFQGGTMDKKLAGLLGAAAALTAVGGAQAATPAQSTEAAPATSYRELLDPVPNALAALMADEGQHAKAAARGETQLAYHHHHHHHHHHGWRRHWHHHHHHHWWGRHHHHHHHQ